MSTDKISVIDYGAGNIASVVNMIKHIGGDVEVISNPLALSKAKKLVLPGVGAFDHGMELLQQSDWIDCLNSAVLINKLPILGICLGMQLMCKSSEEGKMEGLGLIDARVYRFAFDKEHQRHKVPHMGWNKVSIVRENPLITDDAERQRFYFVHSYYVKCYQEENIMLKSNYGFDFVSGFTHENIFGVQFHPEKSHKFGKQLLKNFMKI